MKHIKLFENFGPITESIGAKYGDIQDFYSDQRTLPGAEFTPEDMEKIEDFYSEMEGSEFRSKKGNNLESGRGRGRGGQAYFTLGIGSQIHILPKQDCYLLEIYPILARRGKGFTYHPFSERLSGYNGFKCSTIDDVLDTIREVLHEDVPE